jgi:AcrR family transcriptional regulator
MHGARIANVRDRILAAADELFYRDGAQTVGVDRISKRGGASKKTTGNSPRRATSMG